MGDIKSTRVVTAGLAYLAASDLVVGVWAVLDPAGWYRTFPGIGQAWIGADPPYNQHLATDAGAGFLGVGVVLLVACIWRERHLVPAALAGSLAHDLPHFLFHLLHPATTLDSLDQGISTGGVGFAAVLAGALLLREVRRGRGH